ncbi:MAG: hemerythrin domain-containing protein [Nanoarchaeota archaeon]|nr:hemerythrin domain-containing protein [Nanoarchaeota archaeon]
MMPYEPLMVEHGLIKKMFNLINKKVSNMLKTGKADTNFVDIFSDFFITYVDVAHHGKEENILFNELLKKNLTPAHKNMMNELLEEHKTGRRVVEELINSNKAYMEGSQKEFNNIISRLKDFIDIYSKHVDKEDDDYFIKVMDYFTPQEREKIIQNFWRFDIKLVHEKYKEILDMLE